MTTLTMDNADEIAKDAIEFTNRVISNLSTPSARAEGGSLAAMVTSPMEEMLKLGVNSSQRNEDTAKWHKFFDDADPEVLGEYLEMVKADARRAQAVMARGLTSRGESNYWNCVACQWGLGLFLLVAGSLFVFFSAGSATAPLAAYLVAAELVATTEAATTLVGGVTGALVFTLSYVTSFICTQIPNTCGAPAASWSFLIEGLNDTDSVAIYDATIYGTGNNGIDAWGWGTGGNLNSEVNGRTVTLTSEVKPGDVDPLFALMLRYQVTNAAGVTKNLVLSEMIKAN